MSKPKKKKIVFRINAEMRKFRGIASDMARELGKDRTTIYYQLNGRHTPKFDKVQIPYTKAFNKITGEDFTPEELFSIYPSGSVGKSESPTVTE